MDKTVAAIIFGVVVIAIIVLVAFIRPYDTRRFRGDAVLVDMGPLYPRYRIEFAPIALSASGETRYQFSGAPNEVMTFVLMLSEDHIASVDRERVSLSCSLTDSKGVVAAVASGMLSEWELARRPGRGPGWFWHQGMQDVAVRSREAYALQLQVIRTDDEDQVLHILGTPMLQGGGTEMP